MFLEINNKIITKYFVIIFTIKSAIKFDSSCNVFGKHISWYILNNFHILDGLSKYKKQVSQYTIIISLMIQKL